MSYTWYYVALWPGYGYSLDQAVVYASWDAPAIAAAAKLGCGETLDTSQYEQYLDFIGVPPEQKEDYEDDDYTWFDEPEADFMGYINLRHAILREATPEDMLHLLGEISYELETPRGWIEVKHSDAEDFRKAVYGPLSGELNDMVHRVRVQGTSILFSGTLEELMDELMLSDADQIASRNSKPIKRTKKKGAKR